MKEGKLLVILRFDIESFCYVEEEKRCSLYPGHRHLFDQTEAIKEIVKILDKHKARGIFAVSYDIIKNHPEMMQAVVDSKGRHELTYHLHPYWDLQLQEDYGKPLPSCFMAYYNQSNFNRMLDSAEEAFRKAYGYQPKINLMGNASISTRMLRVLEKRGYLVQGDYIPNMDYRLWEEILQVKDNTFIGRKGFKQGPKAPLYPYASHNMYRPNKDEGMLLGKMGIVVIPLSQIEPGEGLICDSLMTSPEKTMQAIERIYQRRKQLSTLMPVTHTCFGLITGSHSTDIDIKRLQNMDKVLTFIDQLEDAHYCNCMEARERYLLWEKKKLKEYPWARNAINGVMYYDGHQSVKFNSCGIMGSRPVVTICQENGIAEWLVDGLHIGPLIEPKKDWNVLTHPSILSTEIVLGSKLQRLYEKNLQYSYSKSKNGVTIKTQSKEIENIYGIQEDSISLKTIVHQNCMVIHRLHLHPHFNNIIFKEKGRILVENKKEKKILNISTNAEKIITLKEKLYTGLRFYFSVESISNIPKTVLKIKEGENG